MGESTLRVSNAGRTVNRKFVINKLNYLNFSATTVELVFLHREYANLRMYRARPLPCRDDQCDFLWEDGPMAPPVLEDYSLDSLRIYLEGRRLIVINPADYYIGPEGLSVGLPKRADLLEMEGDTAENAGNVRAIISQSGIQCGGELVTFSESVLLVRTDEPAAARWIEGEHPVHVLVSAGGTPLYSETCKIESVFSFQGRRSFRLEIPEDSISRYRQRQFRSSGRELQLAPNVRFRHPLSGRRIERRLSEISGSGFSYVDEGGLSRLPVGVIIPKVELSFPEYSSFSLSLQVIHRSVDSASQRVRYGVCILDIEPRDHLVLLSLVHRSFDGNSRLCERVDLEALWRFFFESGFIYPDKYAHLQHHKDRIRRTFERLYEQRNDVARHFVYQRDDDILGHLSMVRFYEKTWLLHHHASAGVEGRNAGINVLNQVGSYVNDSCRFEKMNLDYLMCYYRPENHFPQRIFGGLVDYVENRKVCSVDPVAYCRREAFGSGGEKTINPLWSFDSPTEDDFILTASFYEECSGGLLLEAMNLPPYGVREDSNKGVLQAYADLEIRREIRTMVARHNGRAAAFFVGNLSDSGINLSELTNSISIFILKPELADRDMIEYALGEFSRNTGDTDAPVLVFPREAADSLNIPSEKTYHLWVMDTGIGDKYFEHIQSILRSVLS